MISRQYAAGLFDGEGSIGVYRNRGSKSDRYISGFRTPGWNRTVTVSGVYKPTIEALRDRWGGSVLQQGVSTARRRLIWKWALYNKRGVGRFLEDLLPYLREKREQALIMLSSIELGGAFLESTALKLKALKKEEFI